MPNVEHLEMIEKGSNAWNEWREKNPNVKPDLVHAPLYNKNLSYYGCVANPIGNLVSRRSFAVIGIQIITL